ncbi:hypothetical protein BD310DRAFT_934191 [Dichomitus squalens]|uniref:Uncharacterized protein n=1 Tax=Dichomitus squalens TaxID=114155 RepID=A0A4Q9PM20_9APHY|nr:hypothetical protein BD310DRAFT_934191 [Dichomitus squalens]
MLGVDRLTPFCPSLLNCRAGTLRVPCTVVSRLPLSSTNRVMCRKRSSGAMEVDRPLMREHSNSFPPPPDIGPRGPAGDLLHHPAPQSQRPLEALRRPQHLHESPFHPMHSRAMSASPPPYARPPLDSAQKSSGPRRSSPHPAYRMRSLAGTGGFLWKSQSGIASLECTVLPHTFAPCPYRRNSSRCHTLRTLGTQIASVGSPSLLRPDLLDAHCSRVLVHLLISCTWIS